MLRKSVFISGASGDIGYEIAKVFASNNYNIFATYNKGNISKLKDLSNTYNVDIFIQQMDLTSSQSIYDAFNKAQKVCEYLDCVVCNAGISKPEKLLTDTEEDEITELINTNLTGTILCNKEALKIFLKQKRGSIINISSIYGMYGGSCESTYSATKAGIIGLTKALAQEYGQFGIRINSVSPGFIQTNMTAQFNNEDKKYIASATPLQRLGNPIDVANTVFFLSTDNASFITGENIIISGGATNFN